MNKLLVIAFTFISSAISLFGQTYNIQAVNGTTISTCGGTFVDDGGVNGNYSNNADYSVTFCPQNVGDKIQVTFSAFNTIENAIGKTCEDYLNIYYGNAIKAQPDDYICGDLSSSLPVITSTSNDGCITFRFLSDGSFPQSGWEATISCITPCQNPTAGLANISDIFICSSNSLNPGNSTVTFDASSSVNGNYTSAPYVITNYDWTWGDGTTTTTTTPTTTHTYTQEGIYDVTLKVRDNNYSTTSIGCSSTNPVNKKITIVPKPSFSGTTDSPLSVQCNSSSTIQMVGTSVTNTQDFTSVISDTVVLPDNLGVSFISNANYSGVFPDGAVLEPGCYPTISFDLEHSWAQDITIELIAPNGSSVLLFNRHGRPFGQNSYKFGSCSNGNDDRVPGCGTTYTVTNSGGRSWTNYGLVGPQAGTNQTTACSSYTGTCEDGTYYKSGNYNSTESFSNLDGVPLNGTWSIRIVDYLFEDDGFLFRWSMSFPQDCYKPLETITPDLASNTVTWSHSGTGPTVPGTQTFTKTSVTDPGPDACPIPGTCLGNQITSSINVGPFTTCGDFDYNAMITDEYGCRYDTIVTVNVICPVTANMSGTTTICPNNSAVITFTGTPNATLTYNVNGGASQTITLNATGSATLNTGPLAVTTNYNLTSAVDPCGQSQPFSETETITVSPPPTAQFTISPSTFCSNQQIDSVSVDLTGQAPWTLTYTINGISNTKIANNSPLNLSNVAGVYQLTSIIDGVCSTPIILNESKTLIINDAPLFTSVSSGGNYCSGDPINDIVVNVGGTGPYTISYSIDGVNQSSFSPTSPINLGNSPGTYNITSLSNGVCSEDTSLTISISVTPGPTITNFRGGNSYCIGQPINDVEVVVTGTAPWSINYTLDGVAQATITSATSPISLGNAEGTYVLTGISDATCATSASGTQTIAIVNPPIVSNMTGGDNYCTGETPNNILVSATGSGPWTINYTLNGVSQSVTSATNPINLGNAVGTYTLTSISIGTCSTPSFDSETISINTPPSVTSLTGGNRYCAGQTINPIVANVTGTGPWNIVYTINGTPFNVSGNTSPISLGNAIGNYSLLTISDANCGSVASGRDTIALIPNPPTVTAMSAGGTYCANDTPNNILVSVTGTAPWTINYTLNGAAQSVTSNTSPINLGSNGGVYQLTSLSSGSCTVPVAAAFNRTIVITPLPTVNSFTGGNTYCVGQTVAPILVEMTGTPSWTLTYSLNGVNQTVTSNTSPISLGNATGTYTLISLIDQNCSNNNLNTTPQTIANPSSPMVISMTGGRNYCTGDTPSNILVTVTGVAPWTVNYTLNGVAQTANSNTNPISLGNAVGTYNITSIMSGTCSGNISNSTATIAINPPPSVTSVSSGGTYCQGDIITPISAQVTGVGPWTISYTLNGVLQTVNGASSPIELGQVAGTYQITQITDQGCSRASTPASSTITINPSPVVDAMTGGNTYCNGANPNDILVSLSGPSPWSINYSLDGVPQSTITSASSPVSLGNAEGVYTLTSVSSGSCTRIVSNSQTIQFVASPSLTSIAGGGNFCTGDIINPVVANVTGVGPWTINFTLNGVAQSVSGVTSPINLGTNPGNYIITGISTSACNTVASGSRTIAISNGAIINSMTGGDTYCTGDIRTNIVVDVSGTAPYRLNYSLNGNNLIINSATSPINLGNQPGNYTLTSITSGSCTRLASNTQSIIVNPIPSVTSMSGGGTFCANNNNGIEVTATGTSPYTVNFTLNGNPQSATSATSPINLGALDGTYILTGITAANCSNTATGTQILTVIPVPVATSIRNGNIYCPGATTIDDILVDVTGASPWTIYYKLDGVSMSQTGNTSPINLGNNPGRYELDSLADAGCSNTASGIADIILNPTPTIDSIYGAGIYCPNTSQNGIEVAITGASPFVVNYLKDGVPSTVSSLTSPVNLGNSIGEYIVQSVTGGTCPSATISDTHTIVQGIKPKLISFSGGNAYCPNESRNNILVDVQGTSPYEITYSLDGLIQTTITSATNPINIGNSVGNYELISIKDALCQLDTLARDTIRLKIEPQIITTLNDTTICSNAVPSNLVVDLTGIGPWTLVYTLDGVKTNVTSQNSPISIPMIEGVYILDSLYDAVCKSKITGQYTITEITAPPSPIISTSKNITYCKLDVIENMFIDTIGNVSVKWYDDVNLSNEISSDTFAIPYKTIGTNSYYVVQIANNCVSLPDTITITINECLLDFPTAFTPDGDNKNDKWEIPQLSNNFPNCKVTIFNRWGNLVFQSDGYNEPWNGEYNNALLPIGSYYFIIDFNDGATKPINGTVSILKTDN